MKWGIIKMVYLILTLIYVVGVIIYLEKADYEQVVIGVIMIIICLTCIRLMKHKGDQRDMKPLETIIVWTWILCLNIKLMLSFILMIIANKGGKSFFRLGLKQVIDGFKTLI